MTPTVKRFEAVLADPRIVGSERVFVESLYSYYKSSKKLTAGRRRCLVKIEQKLDKPLVPVDAALDSRLSSVVTLAQKAGDTWACDFAGSLRSQLVSGRKLSQKQLVTLKKVETRHDPKALATWEAAWTDEKARCFSTMVTYYSREGYYSGITSKATSPDYIPSEADYRRVTENKYARGVLAAAHGPAKFPVGSKVMLRASAPWSVRRALALAGSTTHRDDKLAMVIKTESSPPMSHARGSKRYKVIFVGDSSAIEVEERWIKKYRAPKAKNGS